MNYFGHAALSVLHLGARSLTSPKRAEGESDDAPGRAVDPARFILGSMAPDLFSMIGVRTKAPFVDVDLSHGVRFHIEVDAVFHGAPVFVRLMSTVNRDLRSLGVARGPARAASHIGVEMHIDALLIQQAEYYAGYQSALACCQTPHLTLAPLTPQERAHFTGLCAHLLERGKDAHAVTEERFALRLGRALAGRARLEPTLNELGIIARYLCQFTSVQSELPSLLQQLSPLFEASPRPRCSQKADSVVS